MNVQFPNMFPVDLEKGPAIKRGVKLFYGDAYANRIGGYLMNGGASITPGGTCEADAILSNNATVHIEGTVSGNTAFVDLTPDCYSAIGAIEVAVKWKSSEDDTGTTIVKLYGDVSRTVTDSAYDPGTLIPSIGALMEQVADAVQDVSDLVDDAEAAKTAAQEAAATASAAYGTDLLAADYNSETGATAGSYYIYSGDLYLCTADTTGAWDSTKFTKVNVGGQLGELKSAINQVRESVYDGTYIVQPEMTRKKYIDTNGAEQTSTSSAFTVSDYISIPVGTSEISIHVGTHGIANQISFYNSSKVYISGYNQTGSYANIDKEFDIPENAAYFRLCDYADITGHINCYANVLSQSFSALYGETTPIAFSQTGSGYIYGNQYIGFALSYNVGDTGNNQIMVINDLASFGIVPGSMMRVTIGGASGRDYGVGFSASAINDSASAIVLISAVSIDPTDTVQTMTFFVPDGTSAICIYNRKPNLSTPTIDILLSGVVKDVEKLKNDVADVTDEIDRNNAIVKDITWVKSTVSTENTEKTQAVFRNVSRRVFTGQLTEKIQELSFWAVMDSSTAFDGVLEVWGVSAGNLLLESAYNFSVPAGSGIHEIKIQFPHEVMENHYFSVRENTLPATGKGIILRQDNNESFLYINDVTSVEIPVANLATATLYYFPFTYTAVIGTFSLGKTIIVDKNGNGNYTSIQEAIDNCNDSAENPVTILVTPGTYQRFSMVQKGNDVNDISKGSNYPSTHPMRYISILGFDRDQTIVLDETGEYYTPSAEIFTRGTVANITFISKHNSPPSTPNKPYGYAVHMDFLPVGHPVNPGDPVASGYVPAHVRFENCRFVSAQNSAVGIGLHQDEYIEFCRCRFESTTPTSGDYSTYLQNGAFLMHNFPHVSGISGQHLILDDCTMISNNSPCGMKLTYNYNSQITPFTFELEIDAMRTISVSKAGTPVSISSEFFNSFGIESFGNNFVIQN